MPVMKDLVATYYLTADTPVQFGGSSPTWNKYKGSAIPERVMGGSEHPSEEVVQQEILDGRNVHASMEMAFTQIIAELDSSDTLFNDLKTAAVENNNVWIRRDGLDTNAPEEIIGGRLGLTVGLGKVRQGSEGHRAVQALFEGVGAEAGQIIREFGGGS